jgi:hypothetical protein
LKLDIFNDQNVFIKLIIPNLIDDERVYNLIVSKPFIEHFYHIVRYLNRFVDV